MTLFHGFRQLTIASTLGMAVACGGANMSTYTPVNEQTKFSADSLYSAARDAADQLKYVPRADPQSHSIDTREKEVATSSIPRLSYKYSFHIETSGGLLSITAACTKNSATSEATYSDCGDDRPERVVQELAALKKRTLELAPKVEANTPDWGSFGKAEEPDGGAPAKSADKSEKKSDKKSDKSDKSDKADKKSDKSDKADKKSADKSDDKKASDKSPKADKKTSDKKPSEKTDK